MHCLFLTVENLIWVSLFWSIKALRELNEEHNIAGGGGGGY